MPGMTKKLEQALYKTEQMITNGQSHPEVAAAMAAYGYDGDRWAEGQTLADAAKSQAQANEAAFAAQLGATDAFNEAYDEVWDQAQALAHLCASLFEGDTETLTLLGLHKRRDKESSESEIAWPKNRGLPADLPWASNLYQAAQANSEVAAALASFGYPAERLSEEAAEVDALTQVDNAQESAKAEKQQSIIERDEAVDALHAWRRRTEQVAKLALKDKRQLLELMGLRAQRR